MFKGTTIVEMNEATVIEALQEYLDARIANNSDAPAVVSVTGEPSTPGGKIFKVQLEAKEKT